LRASVQDQLIDQILKERESGEDVMGPNGVVKQLVGRLMNRLVAEEMAMHLGHAPGQKPQEGQTNRRNGATTKTVRTDVGEIDFTVPRDREGTFEPKIVPKHARSVDGFDGKIIAMYARGMSTRDIAAQLKEVYGTEVSPDFISRATEGVLEELKTWQNRPLSSVYLVTYLDAMIVKVRDKGSVVKKAVYLAIGVGLDGQREPLGLWVSPNEGAKFWLSILTELRTRGVEDILILCADGLKGMAEAVEATFPQTTFQTCIVHMIRNALRFVPWKERKAVAADLRSVYTAPNEAAAKEALEAFEASYGSKYPMIGEQWRRRWSELSPFLAFPPEMRKVIYTTNAIEAANRQVRKAIKTRGAFPNEDSALKLIFLALQDAATRWGPNRGWAQAVLQFAIHFGDRMPQSTAE